jgi:hypothetical protein
MSNRWVLFPVLFLACRTVGDVSEINIEPTTETKQPIFPLKECSTYLYGNVDKGNPGAGTPPCGQDGWECCVTGGNCNFDFNPMYTGLNDYNSSNDTTYVYTYNWDWDGAMYTNRLPCSGYVFSIKSVTAEFKYSTGSLDAQSLHVVWPTSPPIDVICGINFPTHQPITPHACTLTTNPASGQAWTKSDLGCGAGTNVPYLEWWIEHFDGHTSFATWAARFRVDYYTSLSTCPI